MNVFKTDYFSILIDKKLKEHKFESNEDSSYIKGYNEDFKGKKLEELVVELCNKKEKTLEEKQLIRNLFNKEVISAEVLSNKYKSDIVVYFKDKSNLHISLKHTNNSLVGGLEVTKNSFSKYFNDKELEKSIFKYEETRYTKGLYKNNFPKEATYFEEYLSKNIKKYLKYILTGSGENIPPDTIMFLDKKTNYIYISSIDEYIDIILKYGTKGTFNTYTNLTRTSGQYSNLKIKVQNPLRMKKFKQNNYVK